MTETTPTPPNPIPWHRVKPVPGQILVRKEPLRTRYGDLHMPKGSHGMDVTCLAQVIAVGDTLHGVNAAGGSEPCPVKPGDWTMVSTHGGSHPDPMDRLHTIHNWKELFGVIQPEEQSEEDVLKLLNLTEYLIDDLIDLLEALDDG